MLTRAWEPARQFSEAVQANPLLQRPPLTETELVQRVVDIANGEESPTTVAELGLGVSFDGITVQVESASGAPLVTEELRQKVISRLQRIVRSPVRARKDLPDEVGSMIGRIIALPYFVRVRGRLRMKAATVPVGIDAACDYAALALITAEQWKGPRLCRCELEGCGRFFLYVQRGAGAPRTKYCSREHMFEERKRRHRNWRERAAVRKHK